jgi:hypothetical protein
MSAEIRRSLSWGLTVVAAVLWFAAFVVLFRSDLDSPFWASAIFVGLGAAAFLAGRLFIILPADKPPSKA